MWAWFSEARTCALPLESSEAVGIGRERVGQHLQGHVALQAPITSFVDIPHPAPRQ
jgi:hypothetical protein